MDNTTYRSRELLREGEADIAAPIAEALARGRRAALQRAQALHPHAAGSRLSLTARFAPQSLWGMGASFASIVAVVFALGLAQQDAIEHDIRRIAAIDERLMLDRLPVQAYMDLGFIAFQEETLRDSASGVTVASISHQAGAAIRQFWTPDTLFRGQSGTQGLMWSKLTSTQREAIAPLETFWSDMEEHRRRKGIKIADRFHQLSPEQQAVAQEKMQEWASMPASDRRQVRAAFGGVTEIIPEDVRVMKWKEYQKLSQGERERLVELAQQKVAQASPGNSSDPLVSSLNSYDRPRNALATRPAKPLAQ